MTLSERRRPACCAAEHMSGRTASTSGPGALATMLHRDTVARPALVDPGPLRLIFPIITQVKDGT